MKKGCRVPPDSLFLFLSGGLTQQVFQAIDQIGLLPREAAIGFRCATKVAVSRRAGIDGLVKVQVAANAARGQLHQLWQTGFQLVEIATLRPIAVCIDGQRFCDADGVGQLQGAAIRQTGSDDVLCQIACGISGRTVHFRGIFARECTTAMGGCAAIGIDDDFATGQTAIAIRTANNKLAGWVNVPHAIPVDWQDVAQSIANVGLYNRANVFAGQALEGWYHLYIL